MFSVSDVLSASEGHFRTSISDALRFPCPVTDSRQIEKGGFFLPLIGERMNGHDFIAQVLQREPALIVCAEAFADRVPESCTVPVLYVRDTLETYQRLARFHRHRFPALRLIAVTGSSGKTSTKEMLRAVFTYGSDAESVLATEGNTNNHIGVPQNLLRLNAKIRTAIIEMGTNHPGEIAALCAIAEPTDALVNMVGRSHIENFGSEIAIAREKAGVLAALPASGFAVFPSDTLGQHKLEQAVVSRPLRFGTSEKADMRVCRYTVLSPEESCFTLQSKNESAEVRWSIPGEHQAMNAAGVALMAQACGMPLAQIAAGLARTLLPGMRSRLMRHGAVTWINDAYNANPESMLAALQWLKTFADSSDTLLVLGDMRELGAFAETAHTHVLESAQTLLPHAARLLIGPCFSAAAAATKDPAPCYPDAASALTDVRLRARQMTCVFLKASRGMHLEILEPEEA